MNLFKYKFMNQHGNVSTRFVNLETITGVVMNETKEGELNSISLLSNAPTSTEYESVPVRAKVDKQGKVVTGKNGQQEIVFTNKPVQKHIIFTIVFQEDMEAFITGVLKESLEDYKLPPIDLENTDLANQLDTISGVTEESVDTAE